MEVFLDWLKFYCIPDKLAIKIRYKRRLGKWPNLKHPLLFSEKIQWLKLYDRTPLHTQCADKYRVRDYVKSVVGEQYLIPLVFESEKVEDVKYENFPDEPFIIKTNHDSGWATFIVRDKNRFDFENARKKIKDALKRNYYHYSREWQYKNIKPRIIAEKLLVEKSGNLPNDYKLHCFNGKVHFVQVDIDRFSLHKRNFYNTSWKLLPFVWCEVKDGKLLWENGRHIEKPSNLNEMIEIAEKLSEPFVYCRVDLYSCNNKVYFGEITFHHGGGMESFRPEVWDLKLGKLVDLSKITKNNKNLLP